MKKIMMFSILVFALILCACGNSNEKPTAQATAARQSISQQDIVGEWQCIDITNGVSHMESIARMQPHLVFSTDNKILSKLKTSDGTEMSQKIASYKIENGVLSSKLYSVSPYIEDGKLIIEDPSADNKSIYRKVAD